MAFIADETSHCKGNVGHNRGPSLSDGDEGWIAVARSMRRHWLVGFGQPVTSADREKGSYSRSEAWIDLIMECRYSAGMVNNNGRKMQLKHGQLLGANAWLAARWNWTPKTVRGFLDRLEGEGMIERFAPCSESVSPSAKPGNRKGKFSTIISLCNYALYQLGERSEGQVGGQVKGELRAGSGQVEGDIYKEETKEQGNKKTKARLSAKIDHKELEKQLLDACNGALDNPVNCQGLLNLAEPIMWLDQGCDLERDILPALRAVGQKQHGKRIRSWAYFTSAVADAKSAREKGKITFNEAGEAETKAERLARYAAAATEEINKKQGVRK